MTTYAETRGLEVDAGVDRIVIDGVDVTYFRDFAVPVPPYTLTEPFAYGSTSITFPQIHAGLERMGVGDLSWVRKSASVVFQRKAADGTLTTDYRGEVLAIGRQGRILTLDIGGQFAGRASQIEKVQPRFRKVVDVGHLINLVAQVCNIPATPHYGEDTGIELPDQGGMKQLAWAQQVCAMSQTADGKQRAFMPVTWGTGPWGFGFKDTTSIDCTLFNDDTRGAVDVSDDVTEQTNVFYGTGSYTADDGSTVRWCNSKYPGLIQGTPPAYPIAGGANFGIGTTDADTITGDGIETLKIRLVESGYLSPLHVFTGVYDQAIYDAVAELKSDGSLSPNGTMTPNAWSALFDLDVTGTSFAGSRVHPIVADPATQKFLYSDSGFIIGRNPAYDPDVIPIERTIDFGPGVTPARARVWCRAQMKRAAGKNFAGTIRLAAGVAAFRGEWAADSSPTAADIMSGRDIRPGMNIWLPLFEGGTLFHISGCDVDADGVTLTVDTQARDLMELAQILDRNGESRRNIRREWNAANLPGRSSGAMVTRDEWFGRLRNKVFCKGGEWTIIPIIGGEEGQVSRTYLRTASTAAAFAAVVLNIEPTTDTLASHIGNPLATLADGDVPWYEDTARLGDWFTKRTLLYAFGDAKQPGGYWPRKHTNDAGNTTTAPITGDWLDDQPWPYLCDVTNPGVLWLAFYPDRDTYLLRGQVFWAQEDDAV